MLPRGRLGKIVGHPGTDPITGRLGICKRANSWHDPKNGPQCETGRAEFLFSKSQFHLVHRALEILRLGAQSECATHRASSGVQTQRVRPLRRVRELVPLLAANVFAHVRMIKLFSSDDYELFFFFKKKNQGSLGTQLCLLRPREALRLGLVPSSSAGSLIRGITSVGDRVAAVTIACSSCSSEEDGPRLRTQCWLIRAHGDTLTSLTCAQDVQKGLCCTPGRHASTPSSVNMAFTGPLMQSRQTTADAVLLQKKSSCSMRAKIAEQQKVAHIR